MMINNYNIIKEKLNMPISLYKYLHWEIGI